MVATILINSLKQTHSQDHDHNKQDFYVGKPTFALNAIDTVLTLH